MICYTVVWILFTSPVPEEMAWESNGHIMTVDIPVLVQIDYVSYFLYYCDKISDQNNLWDSRFILTHYLSI